MAMTPPTNIVGMLGGMGPLATIDFQRKVLEATSARGVQDHVPLLVSCIPQIPDRIVAFRGHGESPLAAIVASGQRLVAGGAGVIVMPCNTAHLWFDAVQAALGLPMIHMVDAAIDDVRVAIGAQVRVGLLATEATLESGLYTQRAVGGSPIQWLLPTAREMADGVTPGIAAVKAGQLEEARQHFVTAVQGMKQRGAGVLLLACTEIPLALDARRADMPMIDATAALARCAVAWSLQRRS